jgi:PhnB protein
MNQITPYLNFDGNCREAMEFYQGILGGALQVMTLGDMDPTTPAELQQRVMNSRLETATAALMASDTQSCNGEGFVRGNNVHLTIECESVEQLETLFSGLAAEGTPALPPHDAPWGARFGMLTDRFGIQWMLNCPIPAAV